QVAGAPGTFGLVDPTTGRVGPAFAPGSRNRLETNAATVHLATSAVNGPPGRTVMLSVDLSFKPQAAGARYGVDVLAVDHAGTQQGFATAGTLLVVQR